MEICHQFPFLFPNSCYEKKICVLHHNSTWEYWKIAMFQYFQVELWYITFVSFFITGIGKQERELMTNFHMMCYVCMHPDAKALKYFFSLKSKRPWIYNNVVSFFFNKVIYFQRYSVLQSDSLGWSPGIRWHHPIQKLLLNSIKWHLSYLKVSLDGFFPFRETSWLFFFVCGISSKVSLIHFVPWQSDSTRTI